MTDRLAFTAFPPAVATRLRALPCRGAFEAHLTIEAEDVERRAAFAALCAAVDVKCVLIELARGAHPSQPMTSSRHRGELAAVIDEVEALYAQICAGGFAVVRVKLEADASAEGVPRGGDGYDEFHAKLRLPAAMAEQERARLVELCAAAGAHLSRNDRERDAAGDATRFVTMRVYGAERAVAVSAFAALVETLAAAGYPVASVKAEYTIYDSRSALDAGWLVPV